MAIATYAMSTRSPASLKIVRRQIRTCYALARTMATVGIGSGTPRLAVGLQQCDRVDTAPRCENRWTPLRGGSIAPGGGLDRWHQGPLCHRPPEWPRAPVATRRFDGSSRCRGGRVRRWQVDLRPLPSSVAVEVVVLPSDSGTKPAIPRCVP